jgi:chromosome partitioning protein
MKPIIAITNNKGGVGKTTITVHLAHVLTTKGLRVLCVDMDTQHNLCSHHFTAKALLSARERANAQELIVNDEITVLPLSFAELSQDEYHQEILRYADNYDVTLIDCPPSLDTRTLAALYAAQYALIPTHLERMSVIGLRRLMEVLLHTKTQVLGIVANMVEPKLSPNQSAWLEQLQTNYIDYFIETRIPASRIFSSAATQMQTAFQYNGKKQNAALDAYHDITNEILKKVSVSHG